MATQVRLLVGTKKGAFVYTSRDGGDHWQRLPGTLPPGAVRDGSGRLSAGTPSAAGRCL
jgi:hypothetical protein